MPTVTVFKSAVVADKPYFRSTESIVKWIRDGKWADKIKILNSIEYNTEEQKRYKKEEIPAVAFQGRFSYRNKESVIEHSGLVALDFDHLEPEELDILRENLIDDKYTYMLFRSCRLNGLKLIVKITPSIPDHELLVDALSDYHKNEKYDKFDDICRLCFVSHDPDIYFNPNSDVWTKLPEGSEKTNVAKKSDKKLPRGKPIDKGHEESFLRLADWQQQKLPYRDGSKHTFLVDLFSACNVYGIPERTTVELAFDKYGNHAGCEAVSYKDIAKIGDSVYSLYEHQHAKKEYKKSNHIPPTPVPEQSNDIPVELSSVGSFPIEVLPPNIQQFINELNRSLNYSKDYLATSILFALATLNGNKYKLKVKNGWNAPTIFWFAIVGEPGTMKTHPVGTILSPIKKIDEESYNNFQYNLNQWDIEKNDNKGKQKSVKPRYKQIFISDATLESLPGVHDFNKRGLGYHKDELVGFIHSMNMYRQGSDIEFWLESFNNNSSPINRVSKDPVLIKDVMVNVIGTIQPSVLNGVLKEHKGNGLTDRFLYTSSETKIVPMSANDIDSEWMEWWNSAIRHTNVLFEYIDSDDTVILGMQPGALEKMIEIDTATCSLQQSDDITEAFKNYLSKSKTYLPRFALLLALMDSIFDDKQLYVDASHVERADKIMKYYLSSAMTIFNTSSKLGEINDIMETLRGKGKAEQIMILHGKGFKNIEIATRLVVSKSYVTNTIKASKK